MSADLSEAEFQAALNVAGIGCAVGLHGTFYYHQRNSSYWFRAPEGEPRAMQLDAILKEARAREAWNRKFTQLVPRVCR